MNLKEVYEILDVERMAENGFQRELKSLDTMHEGLFKEMMKKRCTREGVLKNIQNAINESLAQNPNTPVEILKELMDNETFKNKNLLAANPNTPSDILYKLYELGYSDSLAQNPNAPTELLQQIYDDTIKQPEVGKGEYDPKVPILQKLALNSNSSQEVLRKISMVKDKGAIKIGSLVAKNPSTPLDLLEDFSQSYDRGYVLENPGIPIELMYRILENEDTTQYQFKNYTEEQIIESKRRYGINRYYEHLYTNPNTPSDILQYIEGNYRNRTPYVIAGILENPNTPLSIIERMASGIDYDRENPGDVSSHLSAILSNPKTSTKVLNDIKTGIDAREKQVEEGEFVRCTLFIRDILIHPNASPDILNEYMQKSISEGFVTDEFTSTLKNPEFFSFFRKKEIVKSSLQQKEEELSSLEAEAKTISEAEVLIDQQKEVQDIGGE